MHDLGYVAVGYALTVAAVGGYRWRLAVRARNARSVVRAAARRGGVGGVGGAVGGGGER